MKGIASRMQFTAFHSKLLPRATFAALIVLVWYAAFRLPFAFPPGGEALRSTSYAVGFNNRIAILSVWAAVSLATIIARWRSTKGMADLILCSPAAVSWRVQAAMALGYLIATFAIFYIAQSAESYGLEWESSHFLWRMKLTSAYGLQPYRDYQFEYGPALAYLPILIHAILQRFGATHELSYYLTHYFLNTAGLLSLGYVLSFFVMPGRTREVTFVALGTAAFLPNMGLNGVVFRYTAPFFSLVLLHRVVCSAKQHRSFRVFVTSLTGAALCISLSAEVGIVFLVVLALYAALSASTRAVMWSVAAGLAVSLAVSPLLLPDRYYSSLAHFSQGGNNLPLLPTSPHLLFYLAALIWFLPKWLAGVFASQSQSSRTLLCCLGVLPLMLAPGALGRCDPYHVLFYGLGTVLLAFIYLSGRGTKTAFRTYTVVYLLIFFVGLEMINVWVFRLTPGIVRSWVVDTWRGRRATTEADLTPLLKFDQLALAYGSYGYNKPTQRWLWSHKKIAPEYYMGGMGIYTQSQMAERILDLGRFRHVLIHESYQNIHEQAIHEPCAADEYYLRKALLYPWRLPCVRFALDPDGQISRYLQTDYHVIETVGEYLVLEKNLTADSSPRAPSR